MTLKWDAWNRLVEAKDGQTVIGVYEFDGLQRRVKRHVDSQAPDNPNGVDTYIHYFHNAAWQTLETRETTTESDQPENLQPKYQYVWSPRYIDAAVLRDKNADTDGTCDDERLYYLNDANFNVTTLVDTNGDAVERYLYDAYGKVTMYDGSWANVRSASSYANVVLYTGRERDAETGLHHYRHRSLAVELGRFGSRDPVGYDGVSLYNYAGSMPIAATDPSGLRLFWPPDSLIGEANKRRGHGPWGDSAQHCWGGCVSGILGAIAADIGEGAYPSGDWLRDILAQHVGAACSLQYHMMGQHLACVLWYCDLCCLTGV